ncbi:Uncharacterised protein [Vibrio cholerae]|nr:Uncharacterised protein [Vibrio cholerae]CSC80931.1 Uncharacterised protein [Vibrio cholerae]CSI36996.1 Uncharacterised protein [Vibrio cholerae]
MIAAECGLNGMLHWHVGTQAHRGQHIEPCNIALCLLFGASQEHPATTETTNTVSFG